MPGGRIPIYKPYGCVPLILKGKGVSVPVVHPRPAPHRVPAPLPHTLEDIYHVPCTSAVLSSLQHQPDDVIFMTSSVKNVGSHAFVRDNLATIIIKKRSNTKKVWRFLSKFKLNYL